MKIGAIIQARTSSTRLPGKVLLELPYGSGITVLQQVIRRVKQSKNIDQVIVATTTKKVDDIIIKVAEKAGINWFRGSEKNVLERHYLAAKKNKLDTIVRVTSDCPCIDPEILNKLIRLHFKTKADFTNNCIIQTFPVGINAEVYTFSALETAYKSAKKDYEKDGVSEYIYKTNPNKFKIINLIATKKDYGPDLRVTIDTKEDYALLCYIFEYFNKKQFFNTDQIIKLFHKKPWLKNINYRIINKKTGISFKEQLKEAIKLLDLQELPDIKNFLIDKTRVK